MTGLLLITLMLTLGSQPNRLGIIDAVTAASVVPPPRPPELNILNEDGSPLTGGWIKAQEGQTLGIIFKVSDPADTQGFRDFAMKVTPLNTPEGSDFLFNAQSGLGYYSWTPAAGDASRYPSFTLAFSASNTYLGGTTTKKVNIAFNNDQPLVFDGALPQTQIANIGSRLDFPVTVYSTAPRVKIAAKRLPPGASISKTVKNSANGSWVAYLRWKPKTNQIGKSWTTTFRAQESGRKFPQNQTISSTFTASGIGQPANITITNVSWNSANAQLTARGKVNFSKGWIANTSVALRYTSADGPQLTTIPIIVSTDGNWSYTGVVPASQLPCSIWAQTGSIGGQSPIQGADSSACSTQPSCPANQYWCPETSDMEAMCMSSCN